jgi:hypothetical protein
MYVKKPPLQKLREIIIQGFGNNVRKKTTTIEAEGVFFTYIVPKALNYYFLQLL